MALIKCEECGHMVSDKAMECPNCGAPVEKRIVCEECGAEIPVSATICPQCGYPIKQLQVDSRPQVEKNSQIEEQAQAFTHTEEQKGASIESSDSTHRWIATMIIIFGVIIIFILISLAKCEISSSNGSSSSYNSSTYTPEESKSEETKKVETVEESKPEKIRKVKTVEEARSLINNTTWHYTANISRSSIGFWVKVEFKNGHYTNYYASPADGRWTQDGEGLYEIKEGRFSNTGQKYISVSWKGGGGAGNIRGWHYEYELLLNYDFQFVAYAIGNDDKDYGYMEFGDYEWD